MIHAIKTLGEYQIKSQGQDRLSVLTEDSYNEKNYPYCLLIQFEKSSAAKYTADAPHQFAKTVSEAWTYKNVEVIDHSSLLRPKLLYKKGSANGPDLTPTSKLTEIDKTFYKKIVPWFAKASKDKSLTQEEKTFVSEIYQEFEKNSEQIYADLAEKLKDCQGKGVISVRFLEHGDKKYVGDIHFFKKFFMEKNTESYKDKYGETSVAQNKICAVSGEEADEVFGFFSELKFYTVDKPGMVAGGFQQKNSWKNFPVSLDSALKLKAGYDLVRNKMNFKFYGLRYYLIPNFMTDEGIDDIIWKFTDDTLKEQRINNKDRKTLTNDENDILDELSGSDIRNNVSLNLFFYDQPQKSVLRILLLIKDILPSRLMTIFDAKDVIDNIFCFKLPQTKEGKRKFNFDFGCLRAFFPDSKNKNFLEITERIFIGRPVKYSFLLNHIMECLRTHFAKDEGGFLNYNLIRSFILLNFLNELGILEFKNKEVVKLERHFLQSFSIETREEFVEKIDGFFNHFSNFFPKEIERFIFLNGVLTQYLLNIQRQDRGADPFRKQLKGLKMMSKDVIGLLPKIQEKLEQYDKNYYRPLEQLISEYAIAAGSYKNWKLSVDEINYIFVVGMNLAQYFKIKKGEENDDDNQ